MMNMKDLTLLKHNSHHAGGTPPEPAAAAALSSQTGVTMRRLWSPNYRTIGISLALVVLTLVGLAAPAAADRVLPLLQCDGTRTITYEPGLTYAEVEHQVHIDTIYTSCYVPSDPSLTSGYVPFPNPFTRVEGCNTRRSPSDGVRYDIIHWNNGQSSTLATTYVVDRVNGSLSIKQTGTVIDGFGLGAHVTQMVTAPADPVACASELGLTSQQARVKLTLTPAS